MPTNRNVFRVLRDAGIVTKELLDGRLELLKRGPIPQDVCVLLTAEQAAQLAQERYDVCRAFQKELESFYRKHYQRPYDNKRTLRPIEMADVNVSHDANRTLEYVKMCLEKDDKDGPKVALVHIGALPHKFITIYELYTGRTDLDIRGYFPALFPEAPEIPERDLLTGKQV